MKAWAQITINDLIEANEANLQTGPFGTQLKASDYVSEGIPVINVSTRHRCQAYTVDRKLKLIH